MSGFKGDIDSAEVVNEDRQALGVGAVRPPLALSSGVTYQVKTYFL